MGNCIKCGTELTPNNWAQACQANWVNKCNECIRLEKRLYQQEWRKKNPELDKARSDAYRARLKTSNPIKNRSIQAYGTARKRALKYGMDFDLTPEFLLKIFTETKTCPYFGCEFTYSGRGKTLASLDRIDSSKGYTQNNVRIISYLANLMKSHATEDEIIKFAIGAMRTYEKVQGAAPSAQ